MKHSLQLFLAIYICITANMSIAMELEKSQEKNPYILTEIPIQDPRDAHYLTRDKVLINSKKECSIMYPAENKEHETLFKHSVWGSCIAVHPHKTKFALAAYHYPSDSTHPNDAKQKITIYNAQTHAIEHTIDWYKINGVTIRSLAFSPLDDIIAVNGNCNVNVRLYNYTTHTTTTIKVPEVDKRYLVGYENLSPIFSFHPTQPLITLAWQTVYIHDLTTSTREKILKAPDYLQWCEYTPDGSSILAGTDNKISIMKPASMPHFTVTLDRHTTASFWGTAMHPNNKIIAMLVREHNNYILEYWDINKRQCIVGSNILLEGYHDNNPSPSFSPCGTLLLLLTANMFIELEVPFEALCKDITEEQFLYLLFIIQNMNPQSDVEIPQDTKALIASTLLTTCKR